VDEPPRCAARDCREPASVDLQWRNPRLHDETRVKHWPACPAHENSLADFLDRRGFLIVRAPVEGGSEGR
jgi:hypothetical protein